MIKQGAKLVATWEDIWEELPSQVKLSLQSNLPPESETPSTASLFAGQNHDDRLSPAEKKIFRLLQPDQALQIDEIIEKLEQHLSSSEIFAALFELELAGKIKQLPGKNFVRSF